MSGPRMRWREPGSLQGDDDPPRRGAARSRLKPPHSTDRSPRAPLPPVWLPAAKTTPIPVSCLETGPWSQGHGFETVRAAIIRS